MAKTEEIAGKFLGKKVEGKSIYDPSFLVAVPRQENRTYLGLDEQHFPQGFDTWYGYEFTALTNKGLPLNRVIKITYPSSSPSIVESKSLKLYLNTFAMTKLGETFEAVLAKAQEMITADLSKLLETNVMVSFLDYKSPRAGIFGSYTNLHDLISSDVEVDIYKEDKSLLEVTGNLETEHEHYLMFPCLRSRCRITTQPDYGTVFLYYKSKKVLSYDSTFKYLCSFRNENHFHEECTEMMFTRLSEILDKSDELMITSLYTRRGGIDINPCRVQNVTDKQVLFDTERLAEAGTFSRYELNMMQ